MEEEEEEEEEEVEITDIITGFSTFATEKKNTR